MKNKVKEKECVCPCHNDIVSSYPHKSPKPSKEMWIDEKIHRLWIQFPKLKYSTLSGYDVGLIVEFIIKELSSEREKLKKEVREEIAEYSGISAKATKDLIRIVKAIKK